MAVGRNEHCPCGSNKKFKLCCLRKDGGGASVSLSTETEQLRALLSVGCFAEAERRAERLTQQFPSSAVPWKLLATACLAQGKDAVPTLHTVLSLVPTDRATYAQLWAILFAQGRTDELLASCQGALAADPQFAEAHFNLGNLLAEQGNADAAKDHFHHAITLRPAFAEAHFALGNLWLESESADAAIACYRQALAHKPSFAEVHVNLGNALLKNGCTDDAIASYRQALAATPGNARLHALLGATLFQRGRVDEAIAQYRQALVIDPQLPGAHTPLLFFLSHSDSVSAQDVFSEHLRFAQIFERPLQKDWPQHRRRPHAQGPIKVGFVSGDFRDHAVNQFFSPVLDQLRNQPSLSLHAYYTHDLVDHATLRLQAQFDQWHPVATLSDAELAAKIMRDGIDILIDLSGHTANNRLLTFARKPAPIQISWIGYPNTTGLQAMDYVLCDRFNAPQGIQEPYYVEKFARLPSATAFRPSHRTPDVQPLPALKKGYVTFGSFNRPEKLNAAVIATWSRVLLAQPNARMLLGNVSSTTLSEELTQRFGAHGIGPERLVFHPKLAMPEYLALHDEVDMILDTWPYSGGTTTNLALWMGVPVVTLPGVLRSQCQSAAALRRCGLDDWIAPTVPEFVRIAVQWARAPAQLATLRLELRQRLLTRPACQPETVAHGVATALERVWQRWSTGLPPEHFEIDSASPSDPTLSKVG